MLIQGIQTGEYIYVILDMQLKGYLTWIEKNINGVLCFTTDQLAAEYIAEIYPERPLSVCRVARRNIRDFLKVIHAQGVQLLYVDVHPGHVEPENYAFEELKNYAVIKDKPLLEKLG